MGHMRVMQNKRASHVGASHVASYLILLLGGREARVARWQLKCRAIQGH